MTPTSKCVLTNLLICIDVVEKIDVAFEKWCTMRVNRPKILQDISDVKSGVVVGYKFSVGEQGGDLGNIASNKQVIFGYLSQQRYAHIRNFDRSNKIHKVVQHVFQTAIVFFPEAD